MDINIKRFWDSGSGKQLIEWSGARPDLNIFEQIKNRHKEYDILGDDAIKEIFKDKNFPEA